MLIRCNHGPPVCYASQCMDLNIRVVELSQTTEAIEPSIDDGIGTHRLGVGREGSGLSDTTFSLSMFRGDFLSAERVLNGHAPQLRRVA